MFYGDETFYSEAMQLFRKAGHTIASLPVYINHTYEQVVYFDSEKTILIEPSMLNTMKQTSFISHLFDLNDECFEFKIGSKISYYSICIGCGKKNRSQIVHDVHFILHAAFDTDVSVILFNWEDAVLISVTDVDNNIILSDWYQKDAESDNLAELIHVAQLSNKSAYEFTSDFIYLVARDYYKHPLLDKFEVYGLIPSHYFCTDAYLNDSGEQETLKDLIKRLTIEDQNRYGDDYVEPITENVRNFDDIDAELDMLSFELDMEDEIPDDIVEEEETDDEKFDEYEYGDVDPEIFNDPTLMLKWLETE